MEVSSFTLLRYVVKAAVSLIPGGGIVGELITDFLPSIAEDVYKNWKESRTAIEMRRDMEALAQAEADEVRLDVGKMVEEEAAELSVEVREQLKEYLGQVPASIRRTLRRSEDPRGRTVPNHLIPRNGSDVMRLLPGRMPRFKKGESPTGCGDWVLDRLLGAGGFGEVWLARNPYMQHATPVALKFCLDPSSVDQLRCEATLLGRVMREGRHPGIVELRHTYLRAEVPCLEYEYIEGGELGGLIRKWHSENGGPSAVDAAKVILRIAEVIAFAHSLDPPIVHRDLKPANILVQPGEHGGRFKVADFGIGGLASRKAALETIAGRTKPQEVLSKTLHGSHSPLYSSPEQARGSLPDPRDDVHALGVIWYQLLTGDMTKGSPRGRKWKERLTEERGVPLRHLDILEECIEEDAQDRYESAGILVQLLFELLGKDEHLPVAELSSQGSSAEDGHHIPQVDEVPFHFEYDPKRDFGVWEAVVLLQVRAFKVLALKSLFEEFDPNDTIYDQFDGQLIKAAEESIIPMVPELKQFIIENYSENLIDFFDDMKATFTTCNPVDVPNEVERQFYERVDAVAAGAGKEITYPESIKESISDWAKRIGAWVQSTITTAAKNFTQNILDILPATIKEMQGGVCEILEEQGYGKDLPGGLSAFQSLVWEMANLAIDSGNNNAVDVVGAYLKGEAPPPVGCDELVKFASGEHKNEDEGDENNAREELVEALNMVLSKIEERLPNELNAVANRQLDQLNESFPMAFL